MPCVLMHVDSVNTQEFRANMDAIDFELRESSTRGAAVGVVEPLPRATAMAGVAVTAAVALAVVIVTAIADAPDRSVTAALVGALARFAFPVLRAVVALTALALTAPVAAVGTVAIAAIVRLAIESMGLMYPWVERLLLGL